MNLTAKFNLAVISVLVLGLVATGLVSFNMLRSNARSEIVERAGLMMEAALAMRGYTISEIRPLLAPHMTDTFMPQTVPAYAATQAFNKLRESHPEYTYKEATLNPTNPRDRAVDWEADIISTFRNHPESTELVGTRDTPTGRSLYLARPIQINNEGCLACHSTAAAAPEAMVVQYGPANGFGWKLNEVVGAQIMSVPMTVPEAAAQRAFLTFMGALLLVFGAIVFALNFLLRRLVVQPVVGLAQTADDVSRGQLGVPAFETEGKDEIALLASSFNRMRRSLEKALKMIAA